MLKPRLVISVPLSAFICISQSAVGQEDFYSIFNQPSAKVEIGDSHNSNTAESIESEESGIAKSNEQAVSNEVHSNQSQSHRSRLLEEVVVTAQKRKENLQDIPVTVNAYSAELLHSTTDIRHSHALFASDPWLPSTILRTPDSNTISPRKKLPSYTHRLMRKWFGSRAGGCRVISPWLAWST